MKRAIILFFNLILAFAAIYAEDVKADIEPTDSIDIDEKWTTLEEVVVKAPLVKREADRIVLNVAANPLSANKDAQELLKTAPGVWATDEDLSIYGQPGTTVYVDDRKINMSGNQLMTYLKSIQSSSISTIEIIPKAGAEYSADSSGGVIRINLKRNRVDGINGSAGLNVTAGEYKQWINPFLNLGLLSGKWTFNFNGNANGTPGDRYTSHEESKNSSLGYGMIGMSNHKEKAIQGNVMLGAFCEPNENDKIGLQLDYNPSRSPHASDSETVMNLLNGEKTTRGHNLNNGCFNNFNATINWIHTLDDKGSNVKLLSYYNYQKSVVDEDNEMSWSDMVKDSVYNSDNSNRYNIFTAELSLRKVFNPQWNLTAGAKYTFNDVANLSNHQHWDREAWIANKEYDYDQKYRESIAAVYATANGSAGRWKFKAGLRGEFSRTGGGLISNTRFDLFPNANIAFNLTERGDYTVALGYYRNIHRPSFQSLNPVVRQYSDYSYSVGNPRLTPSFTDALSLDFVLAGRFTVAMGYSETRNSIRQMFVSNPYYPERMYLTWDNEGKERSGFIHGDGFMNLTNWWSLYASLTYVLTSQKLTASSEYDTFGYLRAVVSTTFTLPKEFNFTLNCFYNSKMKIGNITIYPLLNINPTLQKRFGQHWTVSLGVENMLQRRNRLRTTSAEYDRLTHTKSYAAVKFGVTYSFKSGKTFRSPRIENINDNSRLVKE